MHEYDKNSLMSELNVLNEARDLLFSTQVPGKLIDLIDDQIAEIKATLGSIEVTVKYENGEREFPANECEGWRDGKNGFSNYLCDTCGCILEVTERAYFNSVDGGIMCNECYHMGDR